MTHPPELLDRVAARIRDLVRVHPGPNASRALQAGDPIILSGREAEVAAYAALEAIEEARTTEPEPGTPDVRATRYAVCAVPEDHTWYRRFVIYVEWRGDDRWAVVQPWAPTPCLSSSGEWDWEMRPSERTREWIAAHRFDLHTALEMAKREAPKMTVNGWTPAQVLAEDPAP